MKYKMIAVLMGIVLTFSTVSSVAVTAADNTSTTQTEKPDGEPPEMPDGEGGPGNGTPPEKPDGERPDGVPGEMPDGAPGEMPGGAPGEMPDGEMPDGEKPDGEGGPGGAPGGQSKVESYDAANEYSEDITVSGVTMESTEADENAVLVNNDADVTLEETTITRTSDNSTGGDNASFYGVGAAVLVIDGNVTVTGSTITTDADGGAGVFAYGDGTATVSDTTIRTSQGASGGIHVAGGGTLYASNLDVETNGQSSAAIRSDRGGGTMVVDGGTYTSNGVGSPAIYSTADITVSNADLTANGSEAICIEGRNSITLTDCNLTGNMSDDEQNDDTWTVILYQSMSGDSEIGNSVFTMEGGTLTSLNGGLFYTTNTESTFTLKNVEITAAEDSEYFLKCTGNTNKRGWGSAGANGADSVFTGISQEMNGDVIWDSISTLELNLTEGSVLTGAIIDDETWAGEGGDGSCTVNISEDSTWIVTGDSTVTTLNAEGTIVDADGNAVSIVGTDGTVYAEGSSPYTVTVG